MNGDEGQTHFVGDDCDPPHRWPLQRPVDLMADSTDRVSAALDRALGEGVADDEDFAHAIGVLAQQRDEAMAKVERLRDGIERHREDMLNGLGEPAATIDADLWALLDDRTESA